MENSDVLLEPSPQDWCTPERLNILSSEFEKAVSLLLWSQQLDGILSQWVQRQILRDVLLHQSISEVDSRLEQIDPPVGWSEEDWWLYGQKNQLLLSWCRSHWRHRLEAMFLARKSLLDRVTFRMIRVDNLDLANELYFRIRAGEETLERLSWKFGQGDERFMGGLIKNKRLEELPRMFYPLITNLKSLEVQVPRKIDKLYAIYQLRDRQQALFDDSMADELLMGEFKRWQTSVVEHLKAHLTLAV